MNNDCVKKKVGFVVLSRMANVIFVHFKKYLNVKSAIRKNLYKNKKIHLLANTASTI